MILWLYHQPDTRQLCNEFVRAALGHRTPWLRAGEPVMCLKNAPLYGVFNGAVYTLERDFLMKATRRYKPMLMKRA